jgi:uncharacterized Ntn-hydrolase superfamily protein
MTFSITARCGQTGAFGIAVSSSSPAVAARCAAVRAGVGAVASQNITDPQLRDHALAMLSLGIPAPDACRLLQATARHAEYRQLAVVDAAGRTASFSGAHTLGIHAADEGEGAVACGNMLANHAVPARMVEAFAAAEGALGDRLVAAMAAGLDAGGEAGPVRSAGLLIAEREPWPVADLRVDWHDAPVQELARLWALWKPQMADYVTRALDPRTAPSYGVPGDP